MRKYWHVINLVITLITLAGIYLITTGKTSLQQVKDVQASYKPDNLTLPPDYTFSIWGVIYFGFLVFGILQLSPGLRKDSRFTNSRWLITLSILLNLAWIILVGMGQFLIPYFLQWFMMALAVYVIIKILKNDSEFHSSFDRLSFIPFVLHAGWLIVAMIPFTTDVFLSTGWKGNPLPGPAWATLLYFTGTAIIWIVYRRLNTFWIAVPWLWALIGFGLKFTGVVALSAWLLFGIIIALKLYIQFFTKLPHLTPVRSDTSKNTKSHTNQL